MPTVQPAATAVQPSAAATTAQQEMPLYHAGDVYDEKHRRRVVNDLRAHVLLSNMVLLTHTWQNLT